MKSLTNAARAYIGSFILFLLYAAVGAYFFFDTQGALDFFGRRLGLALWLAFPILMGIGWAAYASHRKRKRTETKDLSIVIPRPYLRAWNEWAQIFFFIDYFKNRIVMWVFFVIGVVTAVIFPYGFTGPGGAFEANPGANNIVGAFIGLVAFVGVTSYYTHVIYQERSEQIELIYNMARIPLKYPMKARPRKEEMPFQNAHSAIVVKQWESITVPRVFFVKAPPTLDISDIGPWNTLQANLEIKMPLEMGWHREPDNRGAGYTFSPADYPTGVLWEGQGADEEPLDFLLGADLDDPGNFLPFTFSESSPHACVVGGTGAGKALPADALLVAHLPGEPARFVRNEDVTENHILYDEKGDSASITAFGQWENKQVYRIEFCDGTTQDCSGDHRWTVLDADLPRMSHHAQIDLSSSAIITLYHYSAEPGDITLDGIAQIAGIEANNPHLLALAKKVGVARQRLDLDGQVIDLYPQAQMCESLARLGRGDDSMSTLPSVRTTEEIREGIEGGKGFLLPAVQPLDLPEVDTLPVKPYGVGQGMGYPNQDWNHYALGSIAQRLSMLQGIMDVIGAVDNTGHCTLVADKETVTRVRELASSLGIVASLGAGGALCFTPPPGVNVFKNRAKADILANAPGRSQRAQVHRRITKVTLLREEQPMRCIAVDSPTRQFVVGRSFLPTHNTSIVEAIVAQAAIKPMPWSKPDDPIYAQCYLIDPKGPLANRWENRPNIHVVNGTRETVNEDGDDISGIEAMRNMVAHVEQIMLDRQRIMDDTGVAKWQNIPEDILRSKKLAPLFLVLDEYLDHVDPDAGEGDQVERDNQARKMITQKVGLIARKGRSMGVHIMLIAQTANMTLIGNALMRQLPVRFMLGNMDESSYKSFFGMAEREVPPLPAMRTIAGTKKQKPIPGRGRVQNASGQPLSRIQAFWFGGEDNDETLNKLLPRTKPTLAPSSQLQAQQAQREQEDELMGSTAFSPPPPHESDVEEGVKDGGPENEPQKPEPTAKPPAPKTKAPKPPKPEPVTHGDVVDAQELFGAKQEPEPEPEPQEMPEDPCYHEGCYNPTVRCANPRCPDDAYVCEEHKKMPDGLRWCCQNCCDAHHLTRHGLAPLMPFIQKRVKAKGASINYNKGGSEVSAVITLEGVELVKIRASDGHLTSLDGQSMAHTTKDVRAMITRALK